MPSEADKLTEILALAPGACLIISDGVVHGINDLVVETMGVPRKRLEGTPFTELMVSEVQVEVAKFLDGTGPRVHHLPCRLAAGLTPVELSARRLSDEIVIVGVRRMDLEHHMSALAGADLTHDQVTGLPNRYYVLEQLHQRLTNGAFQPLALIAIWIDDLAKLGDERGIRVVERVSRQVGERIQTRLRGPDLVGRLGDGAFLAVLASDSSPEQLSEIAERLRSEVAFPVEFDGSLVSFTASAFVASVGPRRPTLEQVQARLDAVGTKLMAGGGNRTEIFSF